MTRPPSEMYARIGEKVWGPYPLDVLLRLCREGKVHADTPVAPSAQAPAEAWQSLLHLAPVEVGLITAELSRRAASRATWFGFALYLCAVACGVLLLLCGSLWMWNWHLAGQASRPAPPAADLAESPPQPSPALEEAEARIRKLQETNSQLTLSELALKQQITDSGNSLTLLKKQLTDAEARAESRRADYMALASVVSSNAVVPKAVFIEVDVETKGLLRIDTKQLQKSLETQFAAAGYTIAKEKKTVREALHILATFDQFTLHGNLQAGYGLTFYCYGPASIGLEPLVVIYHASETFGVAGAGSKYKASIQAFFDHQVPRCIKKCDQLFEIDPLNIAIPGSPAPLSGGAAPPSLPGLGSPPEAISGSGYVIASRPLIVTNAHVVEDARRIHVHFKTKGVVREARVLHADPAADLAVLGLIEPYSGYEKLHFPSTVLPIEARLGAEVFSLGYPLVDVLGSNVKYSSGAISGLDAGPRHPGWFQVSVPTQPGNSGGPVFLKDGRFCGIMVGTLNPFLVASEQAALPQNVNYAISAATVEAFLSRHQLLSEVLLTPRAPVRDVEDAKAFAVHLEVTP